MKREFNNGDKIIWDSGFGYDIGIFRGVGVVESPFLTQWEVEICSGQSPGILSLPEMDIHPYTNTLLDEMKNKYGYDKQFSTIF